MAYMLHQDFMIEVKRCLADLEHRLRISQQLLPDFRAPQIQQEKSMLDRCLEDVVRFLLRIFLEAFQRDGGDIGHGCVGGEGGALFEILESRHDSCLSVELWKGDM